MLVLDGMCTSVTLGCLLWVRFSMLKIVSGPQLCLSFCWTFCWSLCWCWPLGLFCWSTFLRGWRLCDLVCLGCLRLVFCSLGAWCCGLYKESIQSCLDVGLATSSAVMEFGTSRFLNTIYFDFVQGVVTWLKTLLWRKTCPWPLALPSLLPAHLLRF